jgi:hypothetical protein
LTYLIKFNNETGLFHVRSTANSSIYGEGKSLYAALDNLEMELGREFARDRLNLKLQVEEKRNDEIELTAKVSITV